MVKKAGFTIIELMVTAAIAGILTTIVISNFPRLNSTLTLQLVVNDVALSLRQAQQYALGAVQRSAATTRAVAYGIHFDLATPKNYVLFADIAPSGGDFSYTPSGSPADLIEGTATLPGNMNVTNMCAITTADAQQLLTDCIAGNPSTAKQTTLDIVFKRPDPESNVNGRKADGSLGPAYVESVVILSTADGSFQKRIHVTQAGQISVR